MTTVGYGDYTPNNAVGRGLVICMLLITFIAVPVEISKLAEIWQNRESTDILLTLFFGNKIAEINDDYNSGWGGRFHRGLTKRSEHVVVTGDAPPFALAQFIRDFFHKASYNVCEISICYSYSLTSNF